MIHVSALGADPDAPSLYARTKAAGEAGVLGAAPSATILPALDPVRAGGRFLQPLRRDGAHVPALPLVGGGETKIPAGVRRRCRAGRF